MHRSRGLETSDRGQKNFAYKQRFVSQVKDRTTTPYFARPAGEVIHRVLKGCRTGRYPREFDGSASHSGIGKQERTQGSAAQFCQPTFAASQGCARDHGSRIHQRSMFAEQVYLPQQCPAVRAKAKRYGFVERRSLPGLAKHAHTEASVTGVLQASGQGIRIQQPGSQVAGNTTARELMMWMPAKSSGSGGSVLGHVIEFE